MADYLPRREAEALHWMLRFADLIWREHDSFGVSDELATRLRLAVDGFERAFREANNPTSRTRPALTAKDELRDRAFETTRMVFRVVKSKVKDGDQLARLGLRPRKKKVRQVPAPERAPIVRVEPASGRTVSVTLCDAEGPPKRARPKNACGALVMISRSAQPPSKSHEWKFATTASRTTCRFDILDEIDNGEPLWIIASWTSPTCVQSPWSKPVCTRLIDTIRPFGLRRAA